jgi:capsid protein
MTNLNKLKRAVTQLVRAEIAATYEGVVRPADQDEAEQKRTVARKRYQEALAILAANIHQLQSGG